MYDNKGEQPLRPPLPDWETPFSENGDVESRLSHLTVGRHAGY